MALPDALGGGAEPVGQLALHLFLQRREAGEPELHGEPDDGRAARVGPAGDVGDGPEGDRLRVGQHDVRDPALGRRELVAAFVDASCDHGPGTDVTLRR